MQKQMTQRCKKSEERFSGELGMHYWELGMYACCIHYANADWGRYPALRSMVHGGRLKCDSIFCHVLAVPGSGLAFGERLPV